MLGAGWDGREAWAAAARAVAWGERGHGSRGDQSRLQQRSGSRQQWAGAGRQRRAAEEALQGAYCSVDAGADDVQARAGGELRPRRPAEPKLAGNGATATTATTATRERGNGVVLTEQAQGGPSSGLGAAEVAGIVVVPRGPEEEEASIRRCSVRSSNGWQPNLLHD